MPSEPVEAPAEERWRLSARARAAIFLTSLVALWFGWSEFRFVCDDAFIAFRHVANAVNGHGYTWNGPPFRPVEGYTSFLWVVLLHAAWALVDLKPPAAAPALGLVFGGLSLLRTLQLTELLPWGDRSRRVCLAATTIILLGVLSNRTFLAWTSSGLETSLVTFLILSWVLALARGGTTSVTGWSALIALTRPDGLLFVAGSAAWVLYRREPRALLPLVLVGLHLLWRRGTYGFWIPNSAAAKIVGPDPVAGARYLGSFALEYGWWVSALVVAFAVVVAVRRRAVAPAGLAFAAVVVGGLFSWYTFWVGGDHFEYRIYHHLVPLGWVALAGVLLWLDARALLPVLALQLLVSLPIPWVHYAKTRGLDERGETYVMTVPVAPSVPWLPYAEVFDTWQAWLIDKHIGMRHQEHKVFALSQLAAYPPRTRRGWREFPAGHDLPVMTKKTVGVPGWTLPQVAIIDEHGLCDAVVGHNDELREQELMAHSRQPPEGYLECFRPNAKRVGRELRVASRKRPLTPKAARACEDRYWDRLELSEPWW